MWQPWKSKRIQRAATSVQYRQHKSAWRPKSGSVSIQTLSGAGPLQNHHTSEREHVVVASRLIERKQQAQQFRIARQRFTRPLLRWQPLAGNLNEAQGCGTQALGRKGILSSAVVWYHRADFRSGGSVPMGTLPWAGSWLMSGKPPAPQTSRVLILGLESWHLFS